MYYYYTKFGITQQLYQINYHQKLHVTCIIIINLLENVVNQIVTSFFIIKFLNSYVKLYKKVAHKTILVKILEKNYLGAGKKCLAIIHMDESKTFNNVIVIKSLP